MWFDYVKIGQQPYNEFGPDLAFLRLPHQTAESLAAYCSFLNLPQQAQLSEKSPPNNTKQYEIVFGVIEEWGADDPSKVLDKGIINGLANAGSVAGIPPYGGFDRLEFTPGTSEIQLPNSYGGTSGGGLWRLYMNGSPSGEQHRVQVRLLGVPFYEIAVPGSSQNIICHGPDSIYNFLMSKIRSHWPHETAGL